MSRIGVWLFPASIVDGSIAGPDRIVEAIVAAEQRGLDEVWLGDEGPSGWDPFILATSALGKTSRIRIGIGVTNPITRHAGNSATMAATIDGLFPGRIALGFGSGGSMPLQPYGLTAATVAQVDAALEVARATLNGTTTSPENTLYTYDPPVSAITAPLVPLYVGARGPRLNTLASQKAEGVFLSGISLKGLDAAIAWAHAERSIDLVIMPVAALDEKERSRLRNTQTPESDDEFDERVVGRSTATATMQLLANGYPDACVGLSLVSDDPLAAVHMFADCLPDSLVADR